MNKTIEIAMLSKLTTHAWIVKPIDFGELKRGDTLIFLDKSYLVDILDMKRERGIAIELTSTGKKSKNKLLKFGGRLAEKATRARV